MDRARRVAGAGRTRALARALDLVAKELQRSRRRLRDGAAVLGCWTTWDKPIKCGGKAYDEKPSS
jgi:hypothetical protein